MYKKISTLGVAVLFTLSASYCHAGEDLNNQQKDATLYTVERNHALQQKLDFDDRQEFENAERGFIDAPDKLEIVDDTGKIIWSQADYDFLAMEAAPDTVNPSLWRNVQMNHKYGLFKVMDGIYQVRGYDMTNITFIEGNKGWIVFDPLMSVECTKAAMQLVEKNLGVRPISAVIISHPHIDHYGGLKGIVSEADIVSGKIPLIVPEGFEEHVVSENLYAGPAMGRRAGYQYGTLLDHDEKGAMSIGIGMGQSKGHISYISPNDLIKQTGEKRMIDGVEMEFQLTPGTEAPVEMNTYFPQKKALWLAENCTGTLHNLYTLRGAEVRDGNAWGKYIMETLAKYGDKAEVVFQSHNWPHWGNEVIKDYMENTAAVYKFINDQTLMYINQGYTSNEIANRIELPEKLEKNWYTRQYYGTVAHNAKAVYQKYMGWYDANPVHLAQLEPTEYAKKIVEYIGNDKKIMQMARRDFERGEYQWVAEITNAIVFAEPSNKEARYLCADAMEQLAYQAEAGPWRNVYLSGAKELREGKTTDLSVKAVGGTDTQKCMTPEMMFDYMAILIDSNAAQDTNFKINIHLTDLNESYVLTMNSGVLLYQKGITDQNANATLTMPKQGLFAILGKDINLQKQLIKIDGDSDIIEKITNHMVTFEPFFNIIEP